MIIVFYLDIYSGQDCHISWDFECSSSSNSNSHYSFHNAWRLAHRCARVCVCRPKYSHVRFASCCCGKNLNYFKMLQCLHQG